MPTEKEINDAAERISEAWSDGASAVNIYDALVIYQAYREECFKSLGLKEYEDGK